MVKSGSPLGLRPIRRTTTLALDRLARKRPAILGYHGVSARRVAGDLHRLQVSAGRFQLHLEMMLEAGFRFVTLAALLDRLADKDGPSPSGARGLAAVTFDDGLRNNLTIAQPILAALGIPATVFVASDLIGSRSPWLGDGAEAEMLSADDLRALVADGWEMGAHTASHADLSQLSYEASIEEISRGVAVLERETGVHVTTLAYPFGSHSTSAMDAARAAGLRAALTTGGTGWEPYALTRAMISAGDPLWVFALKVADAYEPLISSRPARFLRMQSRAWRARLSTG